MPALCHLVIGGLLADLIIGSVYTLLGRSFPVRLVCQEGALSVYAFVGVLMA